MEKKRNRKWNPRGRLPVRVMMLSAGITLLGLIGLFTLSFYLDIIRTNFNQVVKKDYVNLEYVDEITQTFYKHQTLAYRYMTSMEDKKKSQGIEEAVKILQEQIEKIDKTFGENVIGTTYESEYHAVHSGLNGYFKSVSYIFEFNSDGDIATADYYMDTTLNAAIEDVISKVDTLNHSITQDANHSQDKLSNRLERHKRLERLLILSLAVLSAIGYSLCVRITFDIINKDALTQVYNTDKLGRDMDKWIQKGKLNGYVCICSNIKGLSLINQRYGTQVGDVLLEKYALLLQQSLLKNERMARVSGDNFLFLIPKERVQEMSAIFDKITIPVNTAQGITNVSLENRCGIYQIEPTDTFSNILDAAYLAVHEAKKATASDVIWFDRELLQNMYDRKDILTQYKNGISNHEFLAFYQPKTNIVEDMLCGCEALVRWQHDGEIVPPGRFIPLLEEEGSVVELDFYIFETVCRDIRAWLDADMKPVRVSSNFSKLHLQNTDFAQKILELVNQYHIPHELIEIELTESSGYEDFQALTKFVKTMHENDIFVAIDDFGTGYSSLSMLKDLNVDVVKLDKSFIDGVGIHDITREKLLINIIHMIKDLNHSIICEGVETREQADFLKEQGCYQVQGYLYDKPLSHDEFEKRLIKPHYEDH